MELRQLQYFLALAETGSFTRAAERCRIAQPSLSQQILNLELELGQRLFDRLGRRAVLTEPGRRLRDRAQRIIREVDDATREIADRGATEAAGRVTIGVIPTVGPYLMPQLVDRLRSLHPALEIQSYEDFMVYLLEALREGELDFALVGLPVEEDELIAEPLFEDPLLVVLPTGHRLARADRIVPADLATEPLVLLGEKSSLALQIDRFFGGHNVRARVVHRCAQVQTMKAYVAAGLGISILPQLVRNPRDDGRRIVYRSLDAVTPRRTVSLVRHRDRYQASAARTFAARLREFLHGSPPVLPEG